jgi:hypothetical protein
MTALLDFDRSMRNSVRKRWSAACSLMTSKMMEQVRHVLFMAMKDKAIIVGLGPAIIFARYQSLELRSMAYGI